MLLQMFLQPHNQQSVKKKWRNAGHSIYYPRWLLCTNHFGYGININLSGANDHVMQLERNIEMIFDSEVFCSFTAQDIATANINKLLVV